MTQSRKFSEILDDYIDAYLECREAENEAQELAGDKMHVHWTDRRVQTTEEKLRLAVELEYFFTRNK